jgi:hypothetical protein
MIHTRRGQGRLGLPCRAGKRWPRDRQVTTLASASATRNDAAAREDLTDSRAIVPSEGKPV